MKINNTIRKLLLFIIAPLLTITLITACGSDDDGPVTPPPSSELNLVELAQSDDDFSILVDVIVDLGLEGTLAEGNFTVFAPTNAAFNALPDGVLESLTEEQLLDIIQFHVTEGSVPSTALQAQQDVEMLNEEKTLVQSSAAGVIVNGSSNVVKADLEATNGYIHGIDEVLLPKDIRIALEIPNLVDVAEEAGSFSTLIELVEDVGLTTTLQFLGPYTAFAPTDEAFAALFEQVDPGSLSAEQITFILTYHVIGGPGIPSGDLEPQQAVPSAAEELLYITSDEDGVTVNGNASVIDADVDASNGIIHVVDNVLLPNAFLNTVQVAQKNYNFTTLVELIVQADLVEAVASNEFTVFAPTNDAFAALFAEVDPASLSDEQVEEILLYHTIPGATIASGDLQAEQTVDATTEEPLYITVNGDVVVNGNSTVVTADVASNNGIIHAVDTVLLPNEYLNTVEVAQKNYNFTTLVDLIVDAGLVDAVATNEITVFAPTNDAFDILFESVDPNNLTTDQIEEILLYHTIIGTQVPSTALAPEQTVESGSGESLYITASEENGVVVNGSSNVIAADITSGSDGTIHVLDSVLLPNAFLDITAIAQKSYNLTTLVDLLVEYDLVGTLQGDGPFTVFAPTNAAFEAISGVVDGLSDDDIVEVLTYHVLAANVESGDLEASQTVIMLNDQDVTITVSGNVVTVEDANGDTAEVIVADLIGTNGVIHIIDAVLIPTL